METVDVEKQCCHVVFLVAFVFLMALYCRHVSPNGWQKRYSKCKELDGRWEVFVLSVIEFCFLTMRNRHQ